MYFSIIVRTLSLTIQSNMFCVHTLLVRTTISAFGQLSYRQHIVYVEGGVLIDV